MQNKIVPTKPLLIVLYGFPGSGKTTFARQFCEEFGFVHLQADKIAKEVFDGQGNEQKVMSYLAAELLKSGISVVYDTALTAKTSERKRLVALAKSNKASVLTIWFQIDPDTAFNRATNRDRRKTDDKYAISYSEAEFKQALGTQQNPTEREEYAVVSGKHTFGSQRSAILKRLYTLGHIQANEMSQKVAKPHLVNLIPNRSNVGRRNISIR